ncbi:Nramp family divalent metal transporter [Gemmatimonadota bacterium]
MTPTRRRIRIGPGALVAAAFVGPGTVTTCSLAGAQAGEALLWALTFSVIATLVLQEMSLRLGVVGGRGLAEALRTGFRSPILGRSAGLLVLIAVTFGCAAYETGNLLGAALGLETVFPIARPLLVFIIGAVAALILLKGSYRVLESILVGTVIVMSLAFITTLLITGIDVIATVRGALLPSMKGEREIFLVIALIGTTVVPYNLFLHAAAVQERFRGAADLKPARLDAGVSIILGGLISGAIVLTAAGAFHGPGGSGAGITGAGDMAGQLEPLLGKAATIFFSIGLLAAGISSGITAPMAAAYATGGILGWEPGLGGKRQRAVALAVVATGVIFGSLGVHPVQAIMLAQAANGLLLPVVAVFLLWAANDSGLLGEYVNRPLTNIVGGAVVLVAAGLGGWALLKVINSLSGLG